MPAGRDVAASSGRFGPDAYRQWRANRLGAITEAIERRLILRLAGEVRNKSVLDIGCGDGALLFAFRERGASTCIGADVDRRMIGSAAAEATRRNAAVRFLLANAERLPFRDDSFDLVTMITVLAFVAQPQAALREIARVLKPGGRLVIGDLGKWSLWAASRRVRGWLGSAPLWKDATFRSASELRAMAEAAGLHTEHVCGAIYYPRSAAIAGLMAPLDPRLGELTTFGAAFIALQATKAD
jgi:ubiquinone/menaquinone biosynthesis C-methylase UbiE